MAEKVKLTISPAVATYVRPGTSPEDRLAGCMAAAAMTPPDRLMLLFCLSKDADPAIRSEAASCLKRLPAHVLRDYLDSAAPHPLILDVIPLICVNYPEAFAVFPEEAKDSDDAELDAGEDESDLAEENVAEEENLVDATSEEFLSKYKQAQLLGIGEKIKMALTGDKEWRSILVKDANKLVSSGVIKNPRITEGEVLTLVKSGIQNDEIMRLICANKEWVKKHKIRKALIENSRTPVQSAMRFLGTMGEKDLASLAKSKNISTVISTMAKRLLLNKKK
ncbi:MAG: hypothetical protein PHY09_12560 [Desulfuromonadaceae bacterium]|nr:hypothetical protein [Desulfuromonadaceae bacterium]MDD5107388.1 hypothetical protein [Desulfuromonadaceae bacterium]